VRAIMTQHGVPINGFLVSGLISMYSKCGDLDQAVAVFDKWRLYHLLPWLKVRFAPPLYTTMFRN